MSEFNLYYLKGDDMGEEDDRPIEREPIRRECEYTKREQIAVHLDEDVLIALHEIDQKTQKGISASLNYAIRLLCDLPTMPDHVQEFGQFLDAIGWPACIIFRKNKV